MTRSQMSGILIKAHGFIIINANSSDQKKKKEKIFPAYSINSVIYHSIGYHNPSVHLN